MNLRLKQLFSWGIVATLSTSLWAAGEPPAQGRSLTLSQAIALATQTNLTRKLASAATEEARGRARQEAAALLPRLTGIISQTRVFKENLEAQGFPANNPFFSPLLGPYNVFDARIQLVQKILDLNAIRSTQAKRKDVAVADLEDQLAQEQVASATALAYLEALRTARAVEDAAANATLAENLLRLAQDQHHSGLSTGVDVAREETRAAQQNVRLIRARVAANEAALQLKRVVGISLTDTVVLPDTLRASPVGDLTEDQALQIATEHRFELSIVKTRLEADRLALSAAKANHLPVITAFGDYGFSGNLPDNTARTGLLGGRLELPLFYGGQIRGEVQEAEGQERESESRFQDTHIQVEEDVRLALQTLSAEIQEVQTADQAVQLAQRELKMARDRFSAGVGDNIQVLSAQTALADAQDDQVEALARYNTTRINLAMALGEAQKFEF